jgi:predicted esterase
MPAKGARLILFLHGSSMNGLTYLQSFEAKKWCSDDILVCPNGEAEGSDPYGSNNFGFGSAKPVAELTKELQQAFKITRTYIGGHSQGAFVTYSAVMLHPDLFQGALPIAGDCWMQNEPNLWETDAKMHGAQRQVAIAVIHGKADPVVSFSQGEHAFGVFQAAGFQRLRLFAPEKLGHQFMLSPVAEALEWLDAMNAVDAKSTLRLAKAWARDSEWGWVAHAAAAVEGTAGSGASEKREAAAMRAAVEKTATQAVTEMEKKIADDKTGAWSRDWFAFHHRFGSTAAAAGLVERYGRDRARDREAAAALFEKASGRIRSQKDKDSGYDDLRELLAKYPHTYHAWYASEWLRNRK